MTLAVDHPAENHPSLRDARRELQHFDTNRDRYERRRRVQHLTGIGMPHREVAVVVGINERLVARDATAPAPPQRPRLYNAELANDERVNELEAGADLALWLAQLLRDEDVTVVWGALSRLNRRQLQELAVTALAAIPIDQTKSQLLGWVADLPAAKSAVQ